MPKAPEREQRDLICKLSKEEIAARSNRESECVEEIKRVKAARKGLTAQINTLNAEISALAPVVLAGEEERKVDCVWIEQPGQNAWQLVRQDTGEYIDVRPFSSKDMQGTLEIFDTLDGDELGEVHIIDVAAAHDDAQQLRSPRVANDNGKPSKPKSKKAKPSAVKAVKAVKAPPKKASKANGKTTRHVHA